MNWNEHNTISISRNQRLCTGMNTTPWASLVIRGCTTPWAYLIIRGCVPEWVQRLPCWLAKPVYRNKHNVITLPDNQRLYTEIGITLVLLIHRGCVSTTLASFLNRGCMYAGIGTALASLIAGDTVSLPYLIRGCLPGRAQHLPYKQRFCIACLSICTTLAFLICRNCIYTHTQHLPSWYDR